METTNTMADATVDEITDEIDDINITNTNAKKEEKNVKYNKILKKYWGYDKLKNLQFEILYEIINNKKDVCAILSTGFGKSVCYQIMPLLKKKCVIVISPLISLMHEQVMEMKQKNIPVCKFNSDTTELDIANEINELLNHNKHKLIYMTPEYFLKSESFVKKLEENKNLSMICIDEAHTVSIWGLDFRDSYTKLKIIREWTTTIPILTLTATASTKVKDDIIEILKLNNPVEITGDFNRENLSLHIHEKKKTDKNDKELFDILEKFKNEYIFIYCLARKTTEMLETKINEYGIPCKAYHASIANRNEIQNELIRGEFKCIVATIAFGMGINIRNVRAIIHYNAPKNIEGYYQEIGRGGRDGLNSECHLFYSSKDFVTNRYFINQIVNYEYRKYQEEQLKFMEKYVYATTCRRKILLNNFGQDLDGPCNNCDCCLTVNTVEDYMKPLYLFLSVLEKINEKFGSMMTINILLGKTKKIKPYMVEYSEYEHGILFGNETWWKAFANLIKKNDYIYEQSINNSFGSTIGLTKKSITYLRNIKIKYPDFLSIDDEHEKVLMSKI